MRITTAQILRFNRAFRRLYADRLSPLLSRWDLTASEIQVLLFLLNNPGMDTARDVTEYRGLAKSQVSQAVERLVGRGLLKRGSDPADRRVIHLQVTEKGMPLARQAQACQNQVFEMLLAGLTPAEQEQLGSLLQKIFANLEIHAEKEIKAI